MGLALVIVVMKVLAVRGNAVAGESARFWAKIFGLTFVMGVVTGIPLEFQIGASWGRFAHATGGVIGQTLAMEGVFAKRPQLAPIWNSRGMPVTTQIGGAHV